MTRPTLVGLDETLMHQTPWPFRFAAVSDHRFFDRHWLSVVDPNGSGGLLSGAAFYKNLGVADGYVAMQAGDRQYHVRFSRPLTDEMDRIVVGDLEITPIEPFRRLAVSLQPKSSPMAAELEWTSDFGTYVEAHTFDAPAGRVQQDATRYDQVGRWNGWLDYGEGRIDVVDWWGVRDHSWGVRPGVGGFDRSLADPTTDDASALPASPRDSMLHVVLYCEVGDLFVGAHYREDAEGRCLYFDGEVIRRDGRRADIEALRFDADFVAGSRAYDKLTFDFNTREQEFHVEARPLLHAWAYSGTGYDGGYNDGRGLGAWRGYVAEHDCYQHVPPETVLLDGKAVAPGHREQPTTVLMNGEPGMGYCPLMTRGSLPRYGLT